MRESGLSRSGPQGSANKLQGSGLVVCVLRVVPGTICSDERADGFTCAVANAAYRKRFMHIVVTEKSVWEMSRRRAYYPPPASGEGFSLALRESPGGRSCEAAYG